MAKSGFFAVGPGKFDRLLAEGRLNRFFSDQSDEQGLQPAGFEQRCQISVLIRNGLSQRAIASAIAVSQPTISRELARNTGGKGYHHKQAQPKAE